MINQALDTRNHPSLVVLLEQLQTQRVAYPLALDIVLDHAKQNGLEVIKSEPATDEFAYDIGYVSFWSYTGEHIYYEW